MVSICVILDQYLDGGVIGSAFREVAAGVKDVLKSTDRWQHRRRDRLQLVARLKVSCVGSRAKAGRVEPLANVDTCAGMLLSGLQNARPGAKVI